MKSSAKTVSQYLGELSPERQEALGTVRNEILRRLPEGMSDHELPGRLTHNDMEKPLHQIRCETKYGTRKPTQR